MAQDFTMPKLGLTMTDGTIREWLVAEGTMVEAGEPVLIIETDKVETEVEARESGVLTITGVVGENYECGAVIGQLLTEGEAPAAATSAAAVEAPAAAEPASAPVAEAAPAQAPAVAQAPAPVAAAVGAASAGGAADGAGASAVAVATRGEHDRILASPMARAAARAAGVDLAYVRGTGPHGRIVADDVATQGPALRDAVAPATTNGATAAGVAARGEGGRILASPMARAAAREQNLDLDQIAGTGPDGRIIADDVAAFATAQAAAAAQQPAVVETAPPPAADAPAATTPTARPAPAPAAAAVAATGGARMLGELLGIDLRLVPAASPGARVTREDVATWVRQQLAAPTDAGAASDAPTDAPAEVALLQEPTKLVPLRGMRGVIAERMHASLRDMAQLTLSVDVDMSAVNGERNRLKQTEAVVPGYTAWVIAAASRALIDHPYVNSQVTADGVAHLPDVHLGVAVALDEGLIVPVIEHANLRFVDELHTVVADLAARARDGKLKLNELEGGTFSVTALGMYGVDVFTPVINPPNTAILGVGRLRTETSWTDGVPSPVTVMTLSLTWDHRAFDGAPAAEFAQSIVRYLENPAQLIA